MNDLGDVIDELHARVARYVPQRYPVQHATAQFHLGQALLQAERPGDAIAALRASLQWFPRALVVERAKVLNLAGAALRAQGERDAAVEAFTRAATVFAEQQLAAEHGAALFNLGLVQRESGDPRAAAETFAQARVRFAEGPIGPQSTAALQHGAALLEADDVDAAVTALRDAVDLAERGTDREALGAAANALGLALRAAGRTGDAVDAFALAVAGHPRSLRPGAYAMTKANLALAYADAGAPARAHLAARQALAVDEAADPVRVQAQATVAQTAGVTAAGSVLLCVLDDEPQDRWPATVREEIGRWAVLSSDERRSEASAWIEGQARRPEDRAALNHVWLMALLELPPDELDAVIASVVDATEQADSEEAQRFRSGVARAMAFLPVPQLLRVRDRFNTIATERGSQAGWD